MRPGDEGSGALGSVSHTQEVVAPHVVLMCSALRFDGLLTRIASSPGNQHLGMGVIHTPDFFSSAQR